MKVTPRCPPWDLPQAPGLFRWPGVPWALPPDIWLFPWQWGGLGWDGEEGDWGQGVSWGVGVIFCAFLWFL